MVELVKSIGRKGGNSDEPFLYVIAAEDDRGSCLSSERVKWPS